MSTTTNYTCSFAQVIPEEELEVVQLIEEDLKNKIADLGAAALIAWMEDTLSSYIRLEGPDLVVPPEDWEWALRRMLSNGEKTNN